MVIGLLLLALALPLHADERLAGRAARSVHLGYNAPQGTVFYSEVTVTQSADGTYFCVLGFNHGYFGLQQLANGNRLAIFSIWDPGQQNDPNAVPEDRRVQVLHHRDDVRVGRFGNEGTGAQSFFPFDWETGQTYRFLIHATPHPATDTTPGRTTFDAYLYRNPTDDTPGEWLHLAGFRTLTPTVGTNPLDGYYAFVEDFRRNRVSATHERAAAFSNGFVQSTDDDGTTHWHPLTRARFTGDANPALNINATRLDDHTGFTLATGGDTENTDTPLNQWMQREPTNPTPPADLPAFTD